MNMMTASDLIQHMMICKIGHIMHRTVEVYIIVEIALGIFGQFIYTAHCNAAIDYVRTLKEKVSTVQSTERGTACIDHRIITCIVAHKRDHLIVYIVIPLPVTHRF